MSPLTLRRYRAERLLRSEFEGLRARVIGSVRLRLRASGASLDQSDLEACYAQAWQGLYAVLLDGQEIANPAGWLTLVTFRRAIDEHRSRTSMLHCQGEKPQGREGSNAAVSPEPPARDGAPERDFAAELDDRLRLRQLFEGLRGHLNAREREAATLCYLHGLSRAEAAARMGVSESRMRKLMDGAGAGETGVAAKVGALIATISDGRWCEAQGSLMRGYAFGILDPAGERHQLAVMHHDHCPACRSYVRSLRGIAVVLPPVLLPWGVGAAALARAGLAAHASGTAGASAGAGAGAGTGAAATGASAGAGSAAAGAAGAAGAGGAAGGGWLLAGSGTFASKLAAGCLLALSVGAGCIALTGPPAHAPAPAHRRHLARISKAIQAQPAASTAYQLAAQAPAGALTGSALGSANRAASTGALGPAARASREFGPEQALASSSAHSTSSGSRLASNARAASVESVLEGGTRSTAAGESPSREGASAASSGGGSGGAQQAAGSAGAGSAPSKAEREFSPG